MEFYFFIIFTICFFLWGEKPNVLMLAIDDQNDWIGFMGRHPLAITPNIDKLAKSGTAFTNVHSQ
jgi:arylsulfatase A-like enzyme